MSSVSVWEAIFMLVVLKIPVVYLAVVVWWAIRAEPAPGPGGEGARILAPLTPCGWDEWRRRAWARSAALRPRPRPRGPRGSARPRSVAA